MQGKSKIFSKIVEKKKTIVASDMTPEEKVRLYEMFGRYGATQGLTYARFFQRGFTQWEIDGIDAIKRDFLTKHDAEIAAAVNSSDHPHTDTDTDDTHISALTPVSGNLYKMATMYNHPGTFYAMISMVKGLRTEFVALMSQAGMTSNATVLERFTKDNWKEWERRGVRAVLEEFIAAEEQRRVTA